DHSDKQMTALKLIRERNRCPQCAMRAEHRDDMNELCAKATETQLEELRLFSIQFRALKARIKENPNERAQDSDSAGTTLGRDSSVTLAGGTESSLPAEPECLEAGADPGPDEDRPRAEGPSNRRQPKADDH